MRGPGGEDNVIATSALCPNRDCGCLVFSYRVLWGNSDLWDFVCSHWGTKFSIPEKKLILLPPRARPEQWFSEILHVT